VKIIYLRATGGEVGASSALAPKVGPLGLVRNFNLDFSYADEYIHTIISFYMTIYRRRRRSEKILPRPLETGRDYESLSSSPSKTDKRRCLSFHLLRR
jgi:hypothetical protein